MKEKRLQWFLFIIQKFKRYTQNRIWILHEIEFKLCKFLLLQKKFLSFPYLLDKGKKVNAKCFCGTCGHQFDSEFSSISIQFSNQMLLVKLDEKLYNHLQELTYIRKLEKHILIIIFQIIPFLMGNDLIDFKDKSYRKGYSLFSLSTFS